MIGLISEVPRRSANYPRRDTEPEEDSMCPYSNYYPCSIEGCEKQVAGHGWCAMHLRRWRIHGSTDPRPPKGSWSRGRSYNVHHGHGGDGHRSPTYISWQAMIARCTLPKHPAFERYGGRGITVCERWRSFENFLADMGVKPEGNYQSGKTIYSVERIDNDGNYEPSNCRWATAKEQANNRSNNREQKGRTRSLL